MLPIKKDYAASIELTPDPAHSVHCPSSGQLVLQSGGEAQPFLEHTWSTVQATP